VFEIPRGSCLRIFEAPRAAPACTAPAFGPAACIRDVPLKLLTISPDWLDEFPVLFEDAMSLVVGNRIFKQRNVNIATVSKE